MPKVLLCALPLFLSGCALLQEINTSPAHSSSSSNGYNVTGLRGLDNTIDLIGDRLNAGEEVFLTVGVNAVCDSEYGSCPNGNVDLKNSTMNMATISLREKYGDNQKFHLIDAAGLDDVDRANYMLTINVTYTENGYWNGKLINLKTKETLGEYYCVYTGGKSGPMCR